MKIFVWINDLGIIVIQLAGGFQIGHHQHFMREMRGA